MIISARSLFAMNVRPTAGRLARGAAVVVLGLLPFAASCTKVQTQGDGSSYLIIDALGAGAGPTPTTFSGTFESDVLTKGSVLEDGGQVIFRLALKDPGASQTPTTPTSANFITVTRYHVDFVRPGLPNAQQGVDVPFSFDGGMTATVGGGETTVGFVLVRVQAKLEAPLAALANHGGAGVISTIANITFYGTDQTGRAVSVTGSISVNFADWADPAS